MMYKFGTTKRFDKALKLCKKRGYPFIMLLNNVSCASPTLKGGYLWTFKNNNS